MPLYAQNMDNENSSINDAPSPAPLFRMIQADDPIIYDLRFLAAETGKTFLSLTPPFAPTEVINFLLLIDEDSLSIPAKEAYNRIQANIRTRHTLFSSQLFNVGFNIIAELEARLRINSDSTINQHYPLIPGAASLPINLYFKDLLQFYVEPTLIMRPGIYGTDIFEHNIPLAYEELEEQLPLRAFIAAGGEWWNFQLGMDRILWGTGHTGNFIYSNETALYNFARISFFTRNFKYSSIINQMPLRVNSEYVTFPDDEHEYTLEDVTFTETTLRYFYIHRIDFTIKEKVSIGIMEGMMIGNSPIELRYLNPITMFHSFFAWNDYPKWLVGTDKSRGDLVGSFLSIEVNWNIIKSLAFYGQFVLNEATLPIELINNPQAPPDAIGYMAGLQYSHSFKNWGSFFFLEFIYTTPYLSILSSPFASIIQMHRNGGFDYIGYPRDTISLTLGTIFFNNNTLNLNGKISWVSKGESDKEYLLWNWEKSPEALDKITPTGIPQNDIILSLGTAWKAFPNFTFNANFTGVFSLNNGHESNVNKFGCQISLGIKYQYK